MLDRVEAGKSVVNGNLDGEVSEGEGYPSSEVESRSVGHGNVLIVERPVRSCAKHALRVSLGLIQVGEV